MFGLKYYNQLAKNAKFYDEFKGNALSKSNIHRLYNNGIEIIITFLITLIMIYLVTTHLRIQ